MMAGIPRFPSIVARTSRKDFSKKIIREDLEMTLEDFARAYEDYQGH
jgi:hypothetical protein